MTRPISIQDRDTLIAQAASAANCWLIVSVGGFLTLLVGCVQGV
jgi:hypothetical protein